MTLEHDSVITLPDGRTVGYALFGAPSLSRTVFYFHGFPGSRLEVGFAHEAALRHGVSVIGLDRPGFGASSFSSQRKIVDWPNDVLQVADALGVKRFGVFGISGGVPYALACAHLIPERLEQVAIVSGLGSVEIPGALAAMNFFNRKMLKLAVAAPFLANNLVRRLARALHRHPEALIRWLITVSPPADKVLLRDSTVRKILRESFREALRGSGDGVAHELQLISRPWGFDPAEIQVPVHLWHGTADDYVPICMGEHHAKVIPHCDAHFVPGQGHFMVIPYAEEILTILSGKQGSGI